MTESSQTQRDREAHWDAAYQSRGVDGVSWFQEDPQISLGLLDALDLTAHASVIDIGGGASSLVDRLVQRGYEDLTVLDVSGVALESARSRLPADAPVTWIHEDLLEWRPARRYDVWHDRAVFHFLVDPIDRARYVALLQSAIGANGAVVIATFAPDGPEYCSGLPVARYAVDDLLEVLGPSFTVIEQRREVHTTPAGVDQPFTWLAARSSAR